MRYSANDHLETWHQKVYMCNLYAEAIGAHKPPISSFSRLQARIGGACRGRIVPKYVECVDHGAIWHRVMGQLPIWAEGPMTTFRRAIAT